ncbi:MAG: isochorismatase family cysteine hydrolase [Gammaproteobacteria bacterium]
MQPNKDNTVLMVIDMQNGFCHDEGSVNAIGLPAARLRAAVPGCERLVAAARKAKLPVIYTRYMYRPDYADGGIMANEIIPDLKKTLKAGTWDIEVVDELAARENDFIVDKNRPSAFYATNLEPILKGLAVENIVVCGVTTNCCVETTVRDASQRDYRTFVVADAVAEYEDDRHDVALKSMGMLFAYIVSTDDVERAWQAV